MGKKREDPYDFQLFDIEDVTDDLNFRGRREIALILKASESDFNLMKYYLAVKRHVEKLGIQLGQFVVDADEENPQ